MTSPSGLECRPAGRLSVRVNLVGAERAPVVIIDDFLANAQDLAEYAAGLSFRPVSGHLYPGIRAPLPDAYMKLIVGGLPAIVERAFGLSDLDLSRVEGDFSIVATPPEKLQLLQCLPHFDTTDTNQLAVLHYLCPPEMGGTSFYRHRHTGFESVNGARHDSYMATLGRDLKNTGPPARNYIDGDTVLFERIAALDAAFNRLVIYRSATLHSGSIPRGFRFDSDPRTGRLTANSFLHFRRTQNPGPRG